MTLDTRHLRTTRPPQCGHIKARWHNHPSCLSCTSCSRNSICYICSQWSHDVWILAENRRIHAKRRHIMTKKRDNKTKKRNVSVLSDTISLDGSTAPHGYTARGRTHLGGSTVETISNRAISTPVTRHPVTGHRANRHTISFEMVDGHQSFRNRSSYPSQEPNVFLFTDASHYGWGAHLDPMRLSFHDRWTEDQVQLHINMLEMMAIRFALKRAITIIHHS